MGHINSLEKRWDLDPTQAHDGHSVQPSLPSVVPPPTSLHPRLPLKVPSPGEQRSQQRETPLGLAELLFPVQLVEFEEQGKLALSKPKGPTQEVEALLLPLVLRLQGEVPAATSEHIRLSVPHKYCQPADRGDRERKLEERSPHHPLCRPHVPDPGPGARDGKALNFTPKKEFKKILIKRFIIPSFIGSFCLNNIFEYFHSKKIYFIKLNSYTL